MRRADRAMPAPGATDHPLTLVQVRISNAGEAAAAAAAGVDCVDLAVDVGDARHVSLARDVRRVFPGILRLRLETGGLSANLVREMASIPAEEVAVPEPALPTTGAAVPDTMRLVAIVAPSAGAGSVERIRGRAGAVMLDAGGATRLIDAAPIAAIDAFASACRAHRLPFGLAGGLEAPDVARLLLLEPDVLAFDTAVRRDHSPSGPLDLQALDAIRALVPRGVGRSGRTASIAKVTDRVFVRDFEVSLAIGAYQAEHGRRQRVRFGIVADVVRTPGPPHDMRDVFSYDVMIETVRVLSERAHVAFVETLAEEVAASILAHVEVVAVTVKVEKLDVINGAVGIEILRRRDAP